MWYNTIDGNLNKYYFEVSMAKKIINIDLEDVRRLAAMQCDDGEAAAFFRISRKKWKDILNSHEEVKFEWESGRSLGKTSLRRKQFRLASTSASMAIHLGKNVLGQADIVKTEHTGPNGGPMQVIDPSKLTSDERIRLREILGKSRSE